jgi:hypothetical protein
VYYPKSYNGSAPLEPKALLRAMPYHNFTVKADPLSLGRG